MIPHAHPRTVPGRMQNHREMRKCGGPDTQQKFGGGGDAASDVALSRGGALIVSKSMLDEAPPPRHGQAY